MTKYISETGLVFIKTTFTFITIAAIAHLSWFKLVGPDGAAYRSAYPLRSSFLPSPQWNFMALLN